MELLDPNVTSHAKKINFKKELFRFLKYWYWIVISVVLFYAASYFYLKYTQPKYSSKTTLLFQQSNPNKNALNDLKNLGMGVSDDTELQGEASVIISKPILQKVVKSLNLDVSFFAKGKIREIELYNLAPYKAFIISTKKDFYGASYYIEPVNNNAYRLSEGPLKNKSIFRYGEVVELPWGTIKIGRNIDGYKPYKNFVVFKNDNTVVKQLESGVVTKLPGSLLMDLTLVGNTPQKSEDILNEITKQYNIDGVNDKNAEAENTQNFINERLDLITSDLDNIEKDKENFKKANQLTDLDIQANVAVTRLTGNVENIFNESAQLEVINALYEKAVSGKEQLFPTGLGLNETTESLLGQYNELLLTKKRTLKQATDINPTIKSYDKQLSDLLSSVRSNLQEARSQLQKKIGQTNQEIGQDKSTINKYPTQEKIFRNIERQRNLKESIYLYLLQKREENAITLAVTTPKAKVVNPAYTTGIVQPNYKQIRIAAIILGLLLPLIIIFIMKVLDSKIRTKDDVQIIIPDIPIVGEIPNNTSQRPIIENNDFTIFAESFRILTSNIKFILRSKQIYKGGVILVSSSVKGEGKTTISINTALSLAGGAKVLLIGADIRNPQLHKYISNQNKGLTDYLVSETDDISSYIINSQLNDNLDVLFSGSKAPNPNDLLDMQKFDDMIIKLKQKYDYILLDSAPVMLVSDSLHLVDVSDLILYTIKSDFTENEMLIFTDQFRRDNDIQNLVFVLNNVKPEYARYEYKYGYGYYSDVKQENFVSRLFKR
ncbi:GumC family protein [Epilithonimonas zeae]|uniref:GumC family protein n=1 Tax=Epilithonimonas zeae TaxID=1416779 RepID=UPI00200BBCB1|nr:tyrosine-protein kinase domain-containing protein [Epilithonimonas zeae]UQB67456.1 polysaccharide biosynthesis tyrosine autokinase [Epilithonimonas zeae]